MRITCPNCGAQYEVPDEVIPTEGRDVQCSNCGDTWFQAHPDHVAEQVEEVVEHRGEGGTARTLVRLSELSRSAAALREGASLPSPRVAPRAPIYHYTLGLALPGIVDDGEIGVALPPPGVETPVVWLSTRDDWEPSAVKSVVEDGRRRELEVAELAERCRGLFRIAVDPELPLLSFSQWVRWAEVPADVAEVLEQRGRERGADPEQWVCCPLPIERAHWRSLELRHPELGWVPVEL